ncbi:Mov34/MPN/PAD-1 family protein [Pseudomonas triclosanedens]|uniref:Mov34/MPN/PAD-1 family protein n=1 Tax=Pseudomonas triclosanedens TaxID=2961893 RepID=UPI0038B6877A
MTGHDLIDRKALLAIYRHAAITYPEECCGFVFADAGVHFGENIQNQLNQRSPDIYKRSAANGYTFAVADTQMLNRSLSGNNPVRVIYHSHPDVGAYFSREDEEKALFMGQPIFPVAYLVVDVGAGEVRGAKLFEWSGERFECSREFPGTP